jgi:hypothetical protein
MRYDADTNEQWIETEARKLCCDPKEQDRVARILSRYGSRFSQVLTRELNLLGLSLFGLTTSLGIRDSDFTAPAIQRLIKFLATADSIQGVSHLPAARVSALLRAAQSTDRYARRKIEPG